MSTFTLGARLKEERGRLGLTQLAFAELGGVKRVSQHLYEQNLRSPDAEYLLRLHEGGVDVVYALLGRRNNPDAIDLSLDALTEIYRTVEELGRGKGKAQLPIDERIRLFAVLVAGISGTPNASPEELRNRLSQLAKAAA